MPQPTCHNDCKYFGYKRCPHIKNEIMKKATQDIPQKKGNVRTATLDFPADEIINKICENCDSFTLKR